MESNLDIIVDSMMRQDKVAGVLVADSQGLAYATKGIVGPNAAGIISSIAEQASKIHPNSNAPVVILESDNTSVTISKYGLFTGAVYKKPRN